MFSQVVYTYDTSQSSSSFWRRAARLAFFFLVRRAPSIYVSTINFRCVCTLGKE